VRGGKIVDFPRRFDYDIYNIRRRRRQTGKKIPLQERKAHRLQGFPRGRHRYSLHQLPRRNERE